MRPSNLWSPPDPTAAKFEPRFIAEIESTREPENAWSSPLPIIVELLTKHLNNTGHWFREGQSLRLLNKSWSSSVDFLTRKLNLPLSPHVGLADWETSLTKFTFLVELRLNEGRPLHNCYGRKLAILINFNNLKTLEIKNLHLKGKALRILCLKTTLHRLSFSSTAFEGKSLLRLSRLSNLKQLELHNLEGLSKSEEFEFLCELQKLEVLRISKSEFLKRKKVLRNIGNCGGLRTLSLDRSEMIPEQEIGFLRPLTGLRSLRLYCREIKIVGSLDVLMNCPDLEDLELFEVDSKLLEDWIGTMTQLKTLGLSCARIGESFNLPPNVENLIPQLLSLTLYDFTVPSPQLEALIKLGTNLKGLSLGSLTLESRLSFSSLQKLTSFSCNYNRHLESEFLLEMSQVQTLRSLTVGHLKGIVIDQLFTLVSQSLPHLTDLGILDLTFTENRVLALSKAPVLRHLTIIQCLSLNVIPFTCLEALGTLTSLVQLDIACDLGAEFWKEFLNLEFLTQLHCLGMKISEAMDPIYVAGFSSKAPTVKIKTSECWLNSLFNHTLEVFKR